MPTSYGDYDPTALGALASGTKHDAAVRAFGKIINLATDKDPAGGTTNLLHVGRIRKGSVIQPEFKIASTANLSAINVSLGTLDDDDAFSAAAAGPNAATSTRDILPDAQGVVLTKDTDLYLKPSAAWPANGKLIFHAYASHR